MTMGHKKLRKISFGQNEKKNYTYFWAEALSV